MPDTTTTRRPGSPARLSAPRHAAATRCKKMETKAQSAHHDAPNSDWDSLRRGDHILVNDVLPLISGCGPPPSSSSTPAASRHDIAARYTDGLDGGLLVRPDRFGAHSDPVTAAADGWPRDEASAAE